MDTRFIIDGVDSDILRLNNFNSGIRRKPKLGPKPQTQVSNMPHSSYRMRIIYCYTTDYSAHQGKVKIGDTTAFVGSTSDQALKAMSEKAVHKRIKEQLGTSGLKYELLWYEIVPEFSIRDHRVHAILANNGHQRHNFGEGIGAKEWFDVTPEMAHEAYEKACEGLFTIGVNIFDSISLRAEQERFVQNTLKAWYSGKPKRLWNAKMRFGKTPTAYSFIERAFCEGIKPIKRVLILTHRPVVNDGWSKDFEKILKKHGFQYSSKDSAHSNFSDLNKDLPFIHFISMQDVRGRSRTLDGFKESNKEIFDTDWDLIIIDEAHEGNETDLAIEVHDNLSRKFTLYLSGTPFKYLSNGEFEEEDIDTWDYVDEQKAKETWNEEVQGNNPYEGLAKLWINALDIRDMVRTEYGGDADEVGAFNFNEMFRTTDGVFDHKEDVEQFLDVISASGEFDNDSDIVPSAMPYSPERAEQNRHSVQVYPSVDACKAMEELLKKHPVFKDYTIINVSGNETTASKDPLKAVHDAITENEDETRTITLTVGKLTTGVTVKPWTAILMLTNTTSASFYMQTIFRVQSPNEYKGKIKTDAFVYDFAPDRVLKVFTDVADVNVKAGAHNEEYTQVILGNMLNYMPIISHITAEDIKVFDASEVTRQLKAAYTKRVLENGFDSNLLFTKALEKLPPELREVLEEIKTVSKANLADTRQKVDKNIVIAANDFSETIYETISKEVKEIENKPAKERTPEEEQQLKLYKEELKQRENIRAILKTISVRLPFMIVCLMGDEEFKKNKLSQNFSLSEFVDKFDEQSWEEFFGKVTKEMFLSLEPAFDKDILQAAVAGWVEEVEATLECREEKPKEFMIGVTGILSRIKNPDKETVLTPMSVAELVYKAADLGTEEQWRELILARKAEGEVPTIYDINVKSGVFPLRAAFMLEQAGVSKSWSQVCEESIFANARTKAAKWATCTLLGMPKDWPNITVIDVVEELNAEDIKHLSEDSKRLFVGHFLLSPLNNKGNPEAVLSDINNDSERKSVIAIIENYEKELKLLEKEEMSEEAKNSRKKALESQVKKELNSSKQFDYTISNPPYQITTAVKENQQQPTVTNIFHLFQILAMKISKTTTMIYPAGRWIQHSGKGLKDFAINLLNDKGTISVDVYGNGDNTKNKLFPTARIQDGVSIVNWSINHHNKEKIKVNGIFVDRPGENILPVQTNMLGIIDKVMSIAKENKMKTLSNRVSARSLYSIESSFAELNPNLVFLIDQYPDPPKNIKDPIKLFTNDKAGTGGKPRWYWTERKNITTNQDKIDRWQVVIGSALKASQKDIKPEIIPIGCAHGRSRVSIADFGSEIEAKNFIETIRTDFMQKMFLASIAGGLSSLAKFVPDLVNYSKPYSKEELYKMFRLNDEEIKIIESPYEE